MKPPTKIRLGISADELLKMRGRGEDNSVKDPTVRLVGGELVVTWHYADCDAVLKHNGREYVVVEIKIKRPIIHVGVDGA